MNAKEFGQKREHLNSHSLVGNITSGTPMHRIGTYLRRNASDRSVNLSMIVKQYQKPRERDYVEALRRTREYAYLFDHMFCSFELLAGDGLSRIKIVHGRPEILCLTDSWSRCLGALFRERHEILLYGNRSEYNTLTTCLKSRSINWTLN